MNLKKLFQMQAILDARINLEHPQLPGDDRINKKVLALHVEIGELANELPEHFKFWSYKDNNYTEALVELCDSIHFLLSIGNYYEYEVPDVLQCHYNDEPIHIQMNELHLTVANYYVSKREEDYLRLFKDFISLANSIGFTWNQVEKAYYDKNEINIKRVESKY